MRAACIRAVGCVLTAAAYVWDGRQALRPHRCAAAARLERTLQRQVWLCAVLDECGRGRGMCGLTWGGQGLEALGRASFVWQEPTRATLVGLQLDDGGCMQLLQPNLFFETEACVYMFVFEVGPLDSAIQASKAQSGS